MRQTHKAYKNTDFLMSSHARTIRMLCEYEEPRARFHAEKLVDTVVIFGSARVRPMEVAQLDLSRARHNLDHADTELAKTHAQRALAQAERSARLANYYEATREISRRLTEWNMSRPEGSRQYVVCSGGGPGIMEAANRGAAEVPGGRSVGLGISLPFEEKLNPYVTPELGFEFHYFFMRKYWFSYLAKAMVVMPGGFGTLDEMFEILTLRQTGKIKKRLPMVLFGSDYWNAVLNLDSMVEWGTINERDLLLLHRTDSVKDAVDFLISELSITDQERR